MEAVNSISDVALRQQVRWKVRVDLFGANEQSQVKTEEEEWL